MITRYKIYASSLVAILCFSSCSKFVEIESPIDKVVGKEIYNSNSGAASVLTGIYSDMSKDGFAKGRNSLGVLAGLYTDELMLDPSNTDILSVVYANNFTNNEPGLWSQFYSYIFRINSSIEGLLESNGISNQTREQLVGEAKFLRAFFYFYLVNFYGDVPLLLSTDIEINSNKARTDKNEVYRQMITDLNDAIGELSEDYLTADLKSATEERVRPNKVAAKALLARIYLYSGKWSDAERLATEVIAGSSGFSMQDDLNNVFQKNSPEVIWSLQPTSSIGIQKTDAGFYVLSFGINFNQPVSISSGLLAVFENADKRRTQWIGTYSDGVNTAYYPNKYKDISDGTSLAEYTTVLRLAEQYLIRAEARAELGMLVGANSSAEDLNKVRNRAGLGNTSASTKTGLLEAILKERRLEFFTEWGHRFFDIRRRGKIDEIMKDAVVDKGGTWASFKSLYPLPVQDIRRNPSFIGHQNPGYPEL